MSNEWEFFQCQMESGPASIFLDAGLKDLLPINDYTYLLSCRIQLKLPKEDGLSSPEEFQSLCDLEDEIEEVLEVSQVIYAGRITYNKTREYFFYCKEFSSKELFVEKFTKYDYQCNFAQVEDLSWSVYINELYPTVDDWQVINDRRVVESLTKSGDDIQKARLIDHHAYFSDKQKAQYYIERIIDLNFKLESFEEKDEETFQVEFTRKDKPVFPQISSVTLPLARLARSFGGNYGGWATYVEKNESISS